MSSIPTPIRAALGVALTVVDTARETVTHLPQKAAGLPVAAASQAVQLSLRAQQQYAAYVNKGDELIGAFRGAPEEPPAWATFDDDDDIPAGATPARNTAFDRVPDAEDELAELEALDELTVLAATIEDGDPDGDLPTTPELALVTEADLGRPDDDELDRLGPPATPGAPDTVSTEPEVVARDAAGDEVFGDDSPRPTTPREPGRKATRKVATKAVRKTAAKKAPPAKKAAKKAAPPAPADEAPPSTGAGATAGLPAAPAVKKAVAKKAAKKAAPAKKAASPAPVDATPELPLPSTPAAPVSDTQVGGDRPDEV